MRKLFLLFLIAIDINVIAATTFTYSTSADDQTIDGIAVQLRKGNGSNAPASYSSAVRLYAENTITIKATKIKTVYLTFTKNTQKSYAELSVDEGLITSGGSSTSINDEKTDTWTGNVDSVHFTLGTYGQRILKKIVVEAEGGDKFVITYTATSKLPETNNGGESGLHINAFNVSIQSHEFSNGIGTITFAEEVKSIGNNAFRGCDQLTSIAIPNNVTKLGKWSFCNCPLLESVSLSNSIDSIEYGTFMNCSSLSAITIPNSVTRIGDGAFYKCVFLESVTLGNKLKDIGVAVFDSCVALTSITIPNSVTKLGKWAFHSCTSLSSITIPNSVTQLGERAFYNCTNLADVKLSENVAVLDMAVFASCKKLSSITIPNSVISIRRGAFYDCTSLTSIIIPNSVTSIGVGTFYNCSNLAEVKLSENMAVLDTSVFAYCEKLSSITIPNSVTKIGDWAFHKCFSLSSVSIPNSVTQLGKQAFYNCSNLIEVKLSENIAVLDTAVFADCEKLSSIIIPNSVTIAGDFAFFKCFSLSSITIPNSVTQLGKSVFYNCSNLTEVKLSENVAVLDTAVFAYCEKLSSIVLPSSIHTIREGAFYGCTNINTIQCLSTTPPQCESLSFDYVSRTIPLYVPSQSQSKYESAPVWQEFRVEPRDGGYCGDFLLWYYENATLTIVGTGDMYDYNSPTSNNASPWSAFADEIENVIINNGATSIGNYAFYGCTNKNFKSISLPNSLLSIGKYAFYNCSWLKEVTFGTQLEQIEQDAFGSAQRLIYVTCYAEEPPLLGENAFYNYDAYLSVPCDALTEYKVATGWKLFNKDNTSCISAEEQPTTGVTVVPTDNTVTITWPTSQQANTYSIEITKDGQVFCILTFNAQGQLMNIAFAPARGVSDRVSATEMAGGYRFTITSLNPGTKYNYEIDTQNASGTSLANYTGSFTTTGATALDQTSFPAGEDRGEVSKFIRNGQLYILRDGKTYNAQGAEVK